MQKKVSLYNQRDEGGWLLQEKDEKEGRRRRKNDEVDNDNNNNKDDADNEREGEQYQKQIERKIKKSTNGLINMHPLVHISQGGN